LVFEKLADFTTLWQLTLKAPRHFIVSPIHIPTIFHAGVRLQENFKTLDTGKS